MLVEEPMQCTRVCRISNVALSNVLELGNSDEDFKEFISYQSSIIIELVILYLIVDCIEKSVKNARRRMLVLYTREHHEFTESAKVHLRRR